MRTSAAVVVPCRCSHGAHPDGPCPSKACGCQTYRPTTEPCQGTRDCTATALPGARYCRGCQQIADDTTADAAREIA